MKRTFTFLLILFLFQVARSQSGYFSVTGNVVDKENKPVVVGNVIALSFKDSTILKGEAFTEGKFKLDGLSDVKFILKITSVGFKEDLQIVQRQSQDSIINAGTITLFPNTDLNEVNVVAKIPLFEKDAEKTMVNVENTVLSTAGTILDVLRKSPGLLVSQSDNVSVFGKGNALIYIDGQLITSNEILKSIPSSDIKSIEIISNPSAKYDANGRAVINIITKKSNLQGYTGNLIQNTWYGKYLMSYSNVRLQYKNKKWLVFAGYGFSAGSSWTSNDYTRGFNNSLGDTVGMINHIFEKNTQTNPHNYRTGVTFTPDSLNTFGFQYNGFFRQSASENNNTNTISENGTDIFSLHTTTHGKSTNINNAATLNYNRKLDTLGGDLNVTAQYANFSSVNVQNILQNTIIGNSSNSQDKRNTGNNTIQILTGQADLNKPINKAWKLELGLKNSYIPKTGKINFENRNSNGDWIADTAYFNGFNYTENVFAQYGQIRYHKNKLSARAGIRGEHTRANGYSFVQNKKVIDRNYYNLFPSAFIGYDFTKDLNAGLVYSSRISRPSYQDMDPHQLYRLPFFHERKSVFTSGVHQRL